MKSKVVIIGSGGRLGAALVREYREKFEVVGFNHAQIDISDFDEIEQLLTPLSFDILINCAAMTNVDLCEEQPDEAFLINADAPGVLAEICDKKGAKLVHFSTDYVFDGKKQEPYVEDDEALPISIYGESKREGEERVLNKLNDRHLVMRISWVFGPDRPGFIDNIIKRARESDQVDAVADKFSIPTYSHDIAQMLPRLLETDVGGLLHFASSGGCSWQEYGQHALDCCREFGVPLKVQTVSALKLSDMTGFLARRPACTMLSSAKYAQLSGETPRSWREALAEYVKDHYSNK